MLLSQINWLECLFTWFFTKFSLAKKSILNSIVCARVKKSKNINILYVKLVKNSDIIKLANFNTAKSTILADRYVR